MRIARALHDETWASVSNAGVALRPAPRSLEESGLSFQSLFELLTKILFLRGQLRLIELSAHKKLPVGLIENLLGFMRAERLCHEQSGSCRCSPAIRGTSSVRFAITHDMKASSPGSQRGRSIAPGMAISSRSLRGRARRRIPAGHIQFVRQRQAIRRPRPDREYLP